MIVLAAILFLTLPTIAFGGELMGYPRVIDGDSLAFGKENVRMEGIDAPEMSQYCRRADGSEYACGKMAKSALMMKIGTAPVTCMTSGKGRYGRHLGICRSPDGTDLNEFMVRSGWAMAYREYMNAYISSEMMARMMKVGIWQGEFIPPWEFRALKRKKK